MTFKSELVGAIITVLVSVIASSGFWAWVSSRMRSHDATTELLRGLAHDRIIQSGMYFIRRGYVTYGEFEDYHVYVYEPYQKLGGNGLAEQVYNQVKSLPLVTDQQAFELQEQRRRQECCRTESTGF